MRWRAIAVIALSLVACGPAGPLGKPASPTATDAFGTAIATGRCPRLDAITPAPVLVPPTATPGPDTDPAPWERRKFLSTSVTDGGTELELLPGTSLELTFHEQFCAIVAFAGGTGLGNWRVQAGKLVPSADGPFVGVQLCCMPTVTAAQHQQDERFKGFLGSAPTVALSGDALVLVSGAVVIWLVEQHG